MQEAGASSEHHSLYKYDAPRNMLNIYDAIISANATRLRVQYAPFVCNVKKSRTCYSCIVIYTIRQTLRRYMRAVYYNILCKRTDR